MSISTTTLKTNLDRPEESYLGFYDILVLLETAKTLDRLYGRKVAQLYFTNHFTFDNITLTVK